MAAALDVNSCQHIQIHFLERGPQHDAPQTMRAAARPALAAHLGVSTVALDQLIEHVAGQCTQIADLEVLQRL